MTDAQTHSNASFVPSSWSNRILILAIAGILFLTLYPFRVAFDKHLPGEIFPFLLHGRGKNAGLLDVLLNILLFVPYGFGLAPVLRKRGRSRIVTLSFALVAGVLLSYFVELLQIYIPSRDSGWLDVITNSTGTVVGALLFQVLGKPVCRLLGSTEQRFRSWLTWPRAVFLLLLYVGFWSAISVPLQKKAWLNDWKSDAVLVVGNSASQRFARAWKGQVLRFDVWDHALPAASAQLITSPRRKPTVSPDPLADFVFSGAPPFQDQRHFLPALSWSGKKRPAPASDGAIFDGSSELTSGVPISALVEAIRKTHQFALRVVCTAATDNGVNGAVISIAQVSGETDLELRQKKSSLVFWFRTPLSLARARMSWTIPKVFTDKQPRDILLSYDGSALSLFVDGKRKRDTYQLGPGAAVAWTIRPVESAELEGYRYVFYALVFFPAGCLLGFVWRRMARRPIGRLVLAFLAIVAPSVLFELFLGRLGGRALSTGNMLLSAFWACAGTFWINADSAADAARRTVE